MRTTEQKQREKALIKTAESSYKRLKKNKVLFHEMRNKNITQIIESKAPDWGNITFTISKNGI